MHQGIRETREKKMGEMEIYKWMGGGEQKTTLAEVERNKYFRIV